MCTQEGHQDATIRKKMGVLVGRAQNSVFHGLWSTRTQPWGVGGAFNMVLSSKPVTCGKAPTYMEKARAL